MAYLRLLWKESRQDCIRLIVVDVFSGLLQAALAAIIIFSAGTAASAARVEKMGSYLAYLYKDNVAQTSFYLVLFVISIVAFLLTRRFVMIHTGELAERIIAKTRIRIIDKIRQSNLLLYERVGKAHIYSALQESATTLSTSASQIATGFSSAIMLFFTIGYIGYLSLPALVLTLITISAGVLMYMRRIKVLTEETEKSTAKGREFLACLDHFLDGFKEVKMHEPRSQDLYENHLAKIVQEAEGVKNQTTRHFAQMMLFAQTFFYFLLATVIFILPSYDPKESANIVTIAALILFIMGPLGDLIGAFPLVLRSNAAVANIEALEATLDAAAGRVSLVEGPVVHKLVSRFREVECRAVSFAYDTTVGRDSFQLGPFDLTINAGEILFLVGGNGSGKSTLLKVLTGLYPASSGTILWDGRPVAVRNLPSYRSLFSTIFTDFHLFDRLYGLGEQDPRKIEELLSEMELSDLVSIREGRFTTTSLSTGQKKRLALIVALLEGRPILVFDEVGADQDPRFRKKYYEEILQELKKQGRTVIAATHDDAYFKYSDRIFRMEFGSLKDVTARYNLELV
jgi:putative pyoverdin transport system ATP-binding/permease protein